MKEKFLPKKFKTDKDYRAALVEATRIAIHSGEIFDQPYMDMIDSCKQVNHSFINFSINYTPELVFTNNNEIFLWNLLLPISDSGFPISSTRKSVMYRMQRIEPEWTVDVLSRL